MLLQSLLQGTVTSVHQDKTLTPDLRSLQLQVCSFHRREGLASNVLPQP